MPLAVTPASISTIAQRLFAFGPIYRPPLQIEPQSPSQSNSTSAAKKFLQHLHQTSYAILSTSIFTPNPQSATATLSTIRAALPQLPGWTINASASGNNVTITAVRKSG